MPEETILRTANRQKRYRSLLLQSRHTKESCLFFQKVYWIAMSSNAPKRLVRPNYVLSGSG